MPSSRFRTPDQTAAHLAALNGVYEDAAELFHGWSCASSTECCRFGITGLEPYVTSIELAAIRRAVAASGSSLAAKHAHRTSPRSAQALPTGRTKLPMHRAERPCPMLTEEGRCAIYAARPLGCRTFYCATAVEGGRVRQREVNALVRRIQDIAAQHEPGGDKGRPMTRALSEREKPPRGR